MQAALQEDLILPQHVSFYELIKTKVRPTRISDKAEPEVSDGGG